MARTGCASLPSDTRHAGGVSFFSGDVADYYARFRRGFAGPALDFVAARLGAGRDDLVVDLGCGTGQLALPLSLRVRHVLAIDPEPDMLAHGYRLARDRGGSMSWMIGTDADVSTLPTLLGEGAVAAVTISNAIHLMDSRPLFGSLSTILPPGGTVAVIANGTPIWLQDRPWSVALRGFLSERLGGGGGSGGCGTDQPARRQYAAELAAAGFVTTDDHLDFSEAVTAEWIFGNVMSAMPAALLPSVDERPHFAAAMEAALRSAQPDGDFVEDIRLAVLIGRR